MSVSSRLRFLPARDSAIDVMKNASKMSALPSVPAANVIAPTANAASAPPRVSAWTRTAARAISAATAAPPAMISCCAFIAIGYAAGALLDGACTAPSE